MTNTYRGISYENFASFSVTDIYGENEIYSPTETQIHNMIDMIDAIRFSPPPIFDMESFYDIDFYKLRDVPGFETETNIFPWQMQFLGQQDAKVNHTCGTAGCAIGTAAFFGIGEITEGMSWHHYSTHNFGVNINSLWEFCFGEDWSRYDNTAAGAAARILMLIIEGPEAVTSSYAGAELDDVVKIYQKYKDIKVLPN